MHVLGPTGRCIRCKRIFKRTNPNPNAVYVCLKCGLYGAILMQAFNSIINQPKMVEFKSEIETWYLNEA